jgi:hypothetical protein
MDTTMNQTNTEVERAVISGSMAETLTGAAALVLAILGLVQIEVHYMIAIGVIALGVALFFDGITVGAEYSRILARSGNGAGQSLELGGWISTQIGGGLAAVVLGVLALLNLNPVMLTAIAMIVLGATVVLNSGVLAWFNALKIDLSGDHEVAKRVAREALTAGIGTEVLVGFAAAVLGILALTGIAPETLILVAMLGLGAAVLFTGSAVIGKMLTVFAT